jgi:alpha-D-ribose 1-methylphosphonate 5-triphosphate synthase subunit PhnH
MHTAAARLKENRFDRVHDSQRTFRTLMMALAFPGVIHTLKPISLSIGMPDMDFILQPFLTLLDLETHFYVHLKDPARQEEIISYLEINTNSHTIAAERADYILCLESSLNEKYETLKQGTLSHPHHSATVFYRVDEIRYPPETGNLILSLTGPGIKDRQSVAVSGLAPDEPRYWREYKNDYPMGVDIYLVSRTGTVMGIPRSSVIQASGGK